MGKQIRNGLWWNRRPSNLIRDTAHFLPHLLNLGGCDSNCPYHNPVVFEDPYAFITDGKIKSIGGNTKFLRCVRVTGDTAIGKRCIIGPHVSIEDCTIMDDVIIGHGAQLRRCTVGPKVKIQHVGYLGDAEIGEETNMGANVESKQENEKIFIDPDELTVTSNWSGLVKQKTFMGPRCFVGTFVDFIAPVILGEESFVASRTRIAVKEPIPPHSFVWEEIQNGRSKTLWRQNCSFKLPHHWKWIWTKLPIDPELAFDFFCFLNEKVTRYDEWLLRPRLDGTFRAPLDIIRDLGEKGVRQIMMELKNMEETQ